MEECLTNWYLPQENYYKDFIFYRFHQKKPAPQAGRQIMQMNKRIELLGCGINLCKIVWDLF